jgi:hypothetical protein
MDSIIPELRIWKHSHGTSNLGAESLNSEERRKRRKDLKNRSILTLFRNTRKNQGENFRLKMRPGDFFYLCYGNNLKLFGQIVSGLEKSGSKWVERRYGMIYECPKGSKYSGPLKSWTPNFNSTSALVPENELTLFEKLILTPFFSLRLTDLMEIAVDFDEVMDGMDLDLLSTLGDKRYVEGLKKLVHYQRMERGRNQKLVTDAKKHFKSIHKKLYCEVCDFDFEAKFGDRGRDFIEAHHRIPFAKMKAGARLKIADLAMVCANCHRMLTRPPWISIEDLRNTLKSPSHT